MEQRKLNITHYNNTMAMKIVNFLRKKWYLTAILVIPASLFILASLCFPLPKDKLTPQSSTVVIDRNGEWLRAFTAPDDMWRFPETTLEKVSPLLQTVMLTYEDKWFYYHFGINPVSIIGATVDNIKSGKIVRGGSTITMQLARLMEPKDRTIPNKLIEIFRALQLELTYSKTEILTFYFNMLPYGGNIVGSGAASRLYFNKPQSMLSLGEAALLAAIPNSPEYLRPDRFPNQARKAREKVLQRMYLAGKIPKERLQEALQEPIPTERYPLPFKTPHLARFLENKIHTYSSKFNGNQWIHTTIDETISEYLGTDFK